MYFIGICLTNVASRYRIGVVLNDFWHIMTRQRGHQLTHKLIHYIGDRVRHRERWVGALQKTTVPVLLINGSADPVSGDHMAERYKELIMNANIKKLKNIGHYPQTEDPDGVLEAYRKFLSSLKNQD